MEDYMLSVYSMLASFPNWRYGQTLFNALHIGWPELADTIRGTEIDPYHSDVTDTQRIESFFEYLYTVAEKEPNNDNPTNHR
jgi:hypothetical protein